jgi:phosphate uptake regulator
MEKHIFKFGENSAAIIIPKKWIDKNGITPASTVFISENETGSLMISTSDTLSLEADRTITPKSSVAVISRWVGLHYMYGTKRLHIHSEEGMTGSQADAIEEKIGTECPGFEITKQSNKDMIVEDLTNIKEIGLEKIIARLHSLVKQEFKEAREGDPKTIPKIERLVNRFYMLGIRYVNTTQPKDAMAYATHLKLIEFISDTFTLLSSIIDMRGMRIFDELSKQFDECSEASEGNEDAIERVLLTRDQVVRQIQRLKLDTIHKYLLTSIADNSSNIAELGFTMRGKKGREVLGKNGFEIQL